jgi:MFS family permease
VWREDSRFRRYEIYFCIFGFANIMSIPLVQIHSIDVLGAKYRDMALINVVLTQGAVALTLPFWGRMLDRHSPMKLRGVLNLLIAAEYLGLALAPTLGWVFLGRALRGVAMSGGSLVWMLGSLHFAKKREDVPIYLGIHSCLTGLRWLVAPFLGVMLKSHFGDNARPVFLVSSAVIIVTAILMLLEARRESPVSSEES